VLGHLGLAVNRLIRVSFGPFRLGDLAEGAIEEVRTRTLREQLGERLAALAGADFSAPLASPAAIPGSADRPPSAAASSALRHPEVRGAQRRASKGDGPAVEARRERDSKRRQFRPDEEERLGAPELARRERRRGRKLHHADGSPRSRKPHRGKSR
jgi:23S rRNA pseudouridine2605 synthase